LRPGDGIIHSWLNRMLLPDTLGTGNLTAQKTDGRDALITRLLL